MILRTPAVLGLVGLASLAAASPAMARDAGMDRAVGVLSDPAMQHRMGDMLAALTGALMEIDVAPLAKAIDQAQGGKTAKRYRHGMKLGDLAGPEARRAPEEVRRAAPQVMGQMAGMAGAMEAMLPQLEAMAEKLKGAMGTALPGDDVAPGDPAPGQATEE